MEWREPNHTTTEMGTHTVLDKTLLISLRERTQSLCSLILTLTLPITSGLSTVRPYLIFSISYILFWILFFSSFDCHNLFCCGNYDKKAIFLHDKTFSPSMDISSLNANMFPLDFSDTSVMLVGGQTYFETT